MAAPEVGNALGRALLAELEFPRAGDHVLERDDWFVRCDAGALYFTGPDDWYRGEAAGLAATFGAVLDIGCGAGRHALALQERGLSVTALDNSRGATEVCRRRGIRRVIEGSLEHFAEVRDPFERAGWLVEQMYVDAADYVVVMRRR